MEGRLVVAASCWLISSLKGQRQLDVTFYLGRRLQSPGTTAMAAFAPRILAILLLKSCAAMADMLQR